MRHVTADNLAASGEYFDPLWRTTTRLSAVERALLVSWPVRRLADIAHAGAAAAHSAVRER